MATSPSVVNYKTGGANVYFADWTDATTPPVDLETSYLHVGNCLSFSTEPAFEKLIHKSSMASAYEEDDTRIIQKTMALKIKLDEITPENLAYFFAGEQIDDYSVALMEADTKIATIKMVSANTEGPEWTLQLWKVEISGSGAMEWINMGAYGELELDCKILSDVANHPTQRFGIATLPS